MHKGRFFTSSCSRLPPNSNDLEQTNADQIIQTVNEEVTLINKEMQVIMQGDNKHPHINKSGSFS